MWPGSVRRILARKLPGCTRHRTFPARLPALSLDRIYCRPAGAILRSWVEPSAALLSDHLPVVAEIAPAPGMLDP
jgi:endonuclease/exonuclease/phosphatase family metal-dependent hydrolase